MWLQSGPQSWDWSEPWFQKLPLSHLASNSLTSKCISQKVESAVHFTCKHNPAMGFSAITLPAAQSKLTYRRGEEKGLTWTLGAAVWNRSYLWPWDRVREAEQSGGKVQSKAPCGWEGGRGERQKHQRRCESVCERREREREKHWRRGGRAAIVALSHSAATDWRGCAACRRWCLSVKWHLPHS